MTAAPDAPRRTVLIVDDDDDIAGSLTRLLERAGWTVQRARTGTEGVALGGGGAPLDAALVDLVLPGIGGLDVVRSLRRTHPACRILALTGLAERAVGGAFRDAGADACFTKPVDVRALLATLDAPPA